MLKKFFFKNISKNSLVFGVSRNSKYFLEFYNTSMKQKQIFLLPQSAFVFFLSKTSFLLFFSKNITKKTRFFFEQFAFIIKKQVFFSEEIFLFKVFIRGIGFKFEIFKHFLKLFIGYSHPIFFFIPKNISCKVIDSQNLLLIGSNKQLLGQIASRMRFFMKPDVYKQKGLSFFNLSKEKYSKQLFVKVNKKKK